MADIRDDATDITTVAVEGGNLQAYTYGDAEDTILFIQGGPSMRANYLIETHLDLLDQGYRLVFYDPLGTGRSDKPDDKSLWNIERFTREVDAVRAALNLSDLQLCGHSWGAIVSVEYLLSQPTGVHSAVLSHGFADTQYHQREADRLTAALGPEFVNMRRTHELRGTTDHPEYLAGETVLWRRHICRMFEWPAELKDIEINWDIYHTIIGSEWNMSGNLKNWDRIPDLPRIQQPVLVLTGEFDSLTPNESRLMHDALPNSTFHLFLGVGHMSMYECPRAYKAVLYEFFSQHRQ